MIGGGVVLAQHVLVGARVANYEALSRSAPALTIAGLQASLNDAAPLQVSSFCQISGWSVSQAAMQELRSIAGALIETVF
jgi:hypothetical protein